MHREILDICVLQTCRETLCALGKLKEDAVRMGQLRSCGDFSVVILMIVNRVKVFKYRVSIYISYTYIKIWIPLTWRAAHESEKLPNCNKVAAVAPHGNHYSRAASTTIFRHRIRQNRIIERSKMRCSEMLGASTDFLRDGRTTNA